MRPRAMCGCRWPARGKVRRNCAMHHAADVSRGGQDASHRDGSRFFRNEIVRCSFQPKGSAMAAPASQKQTLLQRLDAGPVICAEGYVFELERRGYLQAGPFVPEVV